MEEGDTNSMSTVIDERIVKMVFNNDKFDGNIEAAIAALDKLTSKLDDVTSVNHLSNALSYAFSGTNRSLNEVKDNVSSISERFTDLGIIGVTALQRITNQAIDTGEKLVKSLTVDQLSAGWDKLAKKTTSAGTLRSQGFSMEEVEEQLNRLMWFTDETSYEFTNMVDNIGKFTAAGQGLKDSVTAMEGIANWAALSGQNATVASRAMYQLSQAMSAGVMKRQDYQSIQTANMDTLEFKQKAIEAAIALGTLKKVGENTYQSLIVPDSDTFGVESMVNSLTEGLWFTSDVMMSVFSDYSSAVDQLYDYTNEHGVTASEAIDLLGNDVDAFGLKAFRAAQEARTLIDAINSGKEAVASGWMTTFEKIFGNYDEQVRLWTDLANLLYDVFATSSEYRNTLLGDWKEAGGRTQLFDSIYSIVDSIGIMGGSIKNAFRDLFPKTTVDQLLSITGAFETFANKIAEFTDRHSDDIYNAFHGLFSIVRVGVDIFETFASIIFELVKRVTPLSDIVLKAAGSVGKFVSEFTTFTSNGHDISAVQYFGEVVNTVFSTIQSGAEALSPVLTALGNVFTSVISAMGEAVSKAFNATDFYQISGFLTTLLLGIFTSNNVNGLTETIKKFSSDIRGTITGTVQSLNPFTELLETWQDSLKPKTLMDLAKALTLLAVSMVLIASIDTSKLGSTIAAMSVIMAELFGLMALLSSISSRDFLNSITSIATIASTMITVSISLLALSGALKLMSTISFDDMTTALMGFTAILAGLVGTINVLSKIDGRISTSSLKLIGFATAITVLSVALKILSTINTEHMLTTVAALGGVLLEIAAFEKVLSGTKGSIAIATSLNLIATSMIIFSVAIERLGSIPWDTATNGLLAMGIALGEIAIATTAMSGGKHLISSGIAMTIMASAMIILSNALRSMGTMSLAEIGKSLATLAGSLTILTLGMIGLSKALPGAAALLVISSALTIFAGAISTIGSLPLKVIAVGLVSLVGTLAIVAGAALLLGPIVPVILALAAALALFGVGLTGVSVSIAAFGVALTTLATLAISGKVIITGLVNLFESLIALIPSLLTHVAKGIVSMIEVLGAAASTITKTIVEIVGSLLDAGTTLIPQFVDFGLTLITSLLQGISSRIEDITTAAVDIVVGFLNGLSSRMDDIVAAGFNFAATFISSIGNGISEGLPQIGSAIGDLVSGIVLGFANGIISGISSIVKNIIELGKSVIDALKDFLGIHSPSVKFQELGQYATEGFAIGLTDRLDKVRSAANKVASEALSKIDSYNKEFQQMGAKLITSFIKGVDSKAVIVVSAFQTIVNDVITVLDGYYNQFYNVGMYLDRGFANGIDDYAYLVTRAARQMAQDAYDAAMDELDAASPSKLFTTVGSYVPQGFALGIGSEQTRVKSAATSMADAAISTVNDAVSAIVSYMDDSIDTSPVIKPVLDISEVAQGAQSINTMLSRNQAIAASSGFIQNGVNSSSESVSGNNVYQFTQNNYSPKALSRLEIYRQTKNQFSALKGTV